MVGTWRLASPFLLLSQVKEKVELNRIEGRGVYYLEKASEGEWCHSLLVVNSVGQPRNIVGYI